MSHQGGRDGVAVRDGGDGAALHEHRRAGGVELDELAHRLGERGRQHQPAQTPAGHEETLGKAVGDDEAVVGLGHVQEAGCRAVRGITFEIQAFVELVRHDPGAGGAAVGQDGALLVGREREAGGVGRRVDDERPRGRRDGLAQRVEVQRPGAAARHQRHTAHTRAQDQRLRHQVGPGRREHHHLVARVHQGLRRQHEAIDAARGDRDSAEPVRRAAPRVKPLGVTGDGLAQLGQLGQLGQAQVMRVEGLAGLQRGDGRLADRLGRHLVAFAEPELEHALAADALVGNLPNARAFQARHHLTHALAPSSIQKRGMLQVCGSSACCGVRLRITRKP